MDQSENNIELLIKTLKKQKKEIKNSSGLPLLHYAVSLKNNNAIKIIMKKNHLEIVLIKMEEMHYNSLLKWGLQNLHII